MSPPATTANPHPEDRDPVVHAAESSTANHDLPARSPKEEVNTQAQTDDAATMAASEELRHTTISDKADPTTHGEGAGVGPEAHEEGREMGEHARASTPQHDYLSERLSSPKKKRGRDFEDETRDLEADAGQNGSTTEGCAANPSRTARSEPEKKRPRDTSEDTARVAEAKVSWKYLQYLKIRWWLTSCYAGNVSDCYIKSR